MQPKIIILLTVFSLQLYTIQSQTVEIHFSEPEIHSAEINLQGIHTTGFFKHFPYDSSGTQPYTWQWASQLKPELLRFPGGRVSKFSHLLAGVGYGYDSLEITTFYDYMDDSILNNSIHIDTSRFHSVYAEWMEDYYNDKTSVNNYLDDFIQFVKYIEINNPGHRVKILICLNVLTASATENADIIKYLQNIIPNTADYSVYVAGVEMGNEVYSDDLINFFPAFNDYYAFINGTGCVFADAIPADVLADHSYISKIKELAEPEKISIALVTAPLANDPCVDEMEEIIIDGRFNDWNIQLASVFSDSIIMSYGKIPAFDAISAHPYKNPDCWEYCINQLPDTIATTPFTFDMEDEQLRNAFICGTQKLLENHKIEFKETIQALSDNYFHFNDGIHTKKLWLSEYNLKDHKSQNNESRRELAVFNNTFLHGTFIFNWVLQDYFMNIDESYSEGFLEYAVFHNFSGINEGNIFSKSMLQYDTHNPDSTLFIRRLNYHVFSLLQSITTSRLKMIASTKEPEHSFINTYTFLDSVKNNLYIFFSNHSDTSTVIKLDKTSFTNTFYPGQTVIPGAATLYVIDAKQLYSTSGYNYYYEMNAFYDDTLNAPVFEIKGIDTTSDETIADGIVVPAYSLGYIVIPVEHITAIQNNYADYNNIISIFPNPVNDILKVELHFEAASDMCLKIIDNAGKTIYHQSAMLPENGSTQIDCSNFASGLYILSAEINNISSTEIFIINK
ncbi:MAG: T9SS type A sorting domain-containing protein [Fimbriimonadaceae bacterium]|nr:T9SS type A sorting domain-containing protein [Chitinophagales bacterium]